MTELVRLLAAAEIPEGEIRKGTLPDGTAVALYNLGGQIHATADLCTHGEASLSEEGMIVDGKVECSWHFGAFDIASGKALAMPCTESLRVYPVSIVNGFVHVAV